VAKIGDSCSAYRASSRSVCADATPARSYVAIPSAAKAAEFQPDFLTRIGSRESGLPRDGWAKCDQPMTLPTVLLGPKVGRLSPPAIARLDDGLGFVLDL
jgi:mRNA-degrading endonuclease toxin of MazEF toxin-antitoxin module